MDSRDLNIRLLNDTTIDHEKRLRIIESRLDSLESKKKLNISDEISLVRSRADKIINSRWFYSALLSEQVPKYTLDRFENFCKKTAAQKGCILSALIEYGLDHFDE